MALLAFQSCADLFGQHCSDRLPLPPGGVRSKQLDSLATEIQLWLPPLQVSVSTPCARSPQLRATCELGATCSRRCGILPPCRPADWVRCVRACVLLRIPARHLLPSLVLHPGRRPPPQATMLSHHWPRRGFYASYPCPDQPGLGLSKEQRLRLTLVAHLWPSCTGFADLVQLAESPPGPLPASPDLVTQAWGQILHPLPERLKLAAWCLYGSAC